MKQLVVISGKGGTGKTTIAACLALLARDSDGPVVAADCDVEAANLALLLTGEDEPAKPFVAGRRAVVDAERCISCAMCEQNCRFDAIEVTTHAEVDPLRCEGCGVCALVCATDAITFTDNQAGQTMQRDTAAGPLVHARLGVAQDSSGKLVAEVRQQARRAAEQRGLDLCVVDGPPGIGCPVHAALTGCDLALVVTEPSGSGEHDLRRVLELCDHFQMKAAVLINKHDLAPALSERITAMAEEHGAVVVGRIPFDPAVPRALSRGELPLKIKSFRTALHEAWPRIQELLASQPAAPQVFATATAPEQALEPATRPELQSAEPEPEPARPIESVPSPPQGIGKLTRYADWAVGALETVASVVDALAERSGRLGGGGPAESRPGECDRSGPGRGRGEGRGLGAGRRDGSGRGGGRGQGRGGGQGGGGRGAGDGRGRWGRG